MIGIAFELLVLYWFLRCFGLFDFILYVIP